MDIAQLNTRYGAPGKIVFKDGLGGRPNVVIASKFGTAEISLLGANVLSYRPTGHSEVFFCNRGHTYARGEEVHGGMPLCWPWFGKSGEPGSKSHGFTRYCIFEVRGTNYSEEMTEITLGLKSDAETRSLWNYDFDLEYKISVSMKLNLKVTTVNTGDKPLLLTEGLHPYFLVRNREEITVNGTKDLEYVDARDMSTGVFAADFKATDAADHVLTLPDELKHEFALIDPGLKRALALVANGNRKLVIWNPGPGVAFADIGPDAWRNFLCVEPATLWRDAGFTLEPGEKHSLTAAIQSTLEGAEPV